MTDAEFGRWVREKRRERSLTQEELGRMASMSARLISRVETGLGCHKHTRERIADVLKRHLPEGPSCKT